MIIAHFIFYYFFPCYFAISAPPTPNWFIYNPWGNKFKNEKSDYYNWGIFGKRSYKIEGKTGTEPSDGGKGGSGGIGGNAGICRLNFFDLCPKFVISNNKGTLLIENLK